jgi:flagellar M-ring protein FliF
MAIETSTAGSAKKGGVGDGVKAFGQKLWSDFRGFSPGQKAVTVAAALALLIGGYFLMTWKSSPTYAPLYTNLAPSDASAIVDKLNSSGVPYKLGAAGTEVLVPQDKVYSTRLTLSAAGLPSSEQSGYDLLDKEGVTTSQFQQQIDYQRAIEGELAKTIQSINGVTSASVHLAIPQQTVFTDGNLKPTAAVLLTTNPGTTLTSGQVQSVVNLVSSSVTGMSASDVTVSDQNGTVLNAPGQGVTSAASAATQAEATQTYDNQIAASIQNLLDATLGPGHARVTVNSTLDFNKTSTTEHSYVFNKNSPPVSESTTKETFNGAGAGAGNGTLGTTGTDTAGNGTTTTTGQNGKYLKSTKTVDNALGTLSKTTENAPGQVQQQAIAVLVDKSVKNLNIAALTQLVKSGVGFNSTRGDTLSVQALPFDNSVQKAAAAQAAAATKAAAAKASQQKMASMIKQGALGILVVGFLVGVFLAGKRRKRAEPEPNDDLFGLDDRDYDYSGGSAAPMHAGEKSFSPAAADLKFSNEQRRGLADVANHRPEEVARVLSTWLSAKES